MERRESTQGRALAPNLPMIEAPGRLPAPGRHTAQAPPARGFQGVAGAVGIAAGGRQPQVEGMVRGHDVARVGARGAFADHGDVDRGMPDAGRRPRLRPPPAGPLLDVVPRRFGDRPGIAGAGKPDVAWAAAAAWAVPAPVQGLPCTTIGHSMRFPHSCHEAT